MGIKDLHPLLQKHAPSYSKIKHLNEFAFQKIAIDISLYLYKYKALAKNSWPEAPDHVITNCWIGLFLDLICCLRKADIHPLFVYDGPAPVDKLIEQQRRRDSVEQQKNKIRKLERELEEFLQTGTVGEEIEKLASVPTSLFHPEDKKIDVLTVQNKIKKMKSMVDIAPTLSDVQLTKKLFELLQIPYITPDNEAERYASQLCVLGKVDAVLSEDTDVLAYGTPVFLTKIDTRSSTVYEIRHETIQQELEFSKEQFTDLCILLGCDYNSNVYGYGWNKSFQLLQTHKTIEQVLLQIQKDLETKPSPKVNVEVLRYQRCRELFQTPSEINYYPPYCGIWNDPKPIQEFFFVNLIQYNLDKLIRDVGPRKITFQY